MTILVVGGGGREHALAHCLSQSDEKANIMIAPGNAGTLQVGKNVPVKADDIPGLLALVRRENIGLTVVGPEVPLVAGVADAFSACRMPVVGPSAAAAEIEGSKAFAKDFMARRGIPTAAYATFRDYGAAASYLRTTPAPIVVKASGLAAGKGALICTDQREAQQALKRLMNGRDFGDAGDEVVIEEFMEGEEASIFVLTDGDSYVTLAPAQDHKRVGDSDSGPNTGGMGAYAPAPIADEVVLARVCREIVEPTLEGLASEDRPYRGCLYVGIMLTQEGPKVVEFNCRLGDPEAQAVLPLMDGDLVEAFAALASGRLASVRLGTRKAAAACVVMASGGYPGPYRSGMPITGLQEVATMPDVTVFHAGTKVNDQGRIVTAGGRVLGVTGMGENLGQALDRSYSAVKRLDFADAHYRRDIGRKGLRN